ncbi:MBL fold metallo-hydrolase [Levilactobacillus zymae]|uniref:MBL fold metallo-hydrolase n=1 Tax=Levilactobacillus zymae TaxID=267363 RepID=UPI0028BC9940|nr:MBL fold metallo-hydrolase [Levilactobacillus zymae]MDT6979456.1 MBL fold metallo-hydrolase [Levilactobacillus zymae]
MSTQQVDDLRISILSSGSTGNVCYVESPNERLLIDAGLSGKKIEKLMGDIDRSLTDVNALLVTHEHTDHRKAVGILARRYEQLDVYANQGTWDAMAPRIGKVDLAQKHLFAPDTVQTFGDIDVESFSVSHDAAEPQFYALHYHDKTFVILTDTGYVSEHVEGVIKDADAYLLECNHDVEMLRMGDYSWPLKQRILGDKGHLSNEEGADVLMDVLGNRTKKIYLGHRSLHNNMKSLCHLTVASMMENQDFGVGNDFKLIDTNPEEATPLEAI